MKRNLICTTDFEIEIKEDCSPVIIEALVDENIGRHYVFIGTDQENPKVIWYDFKKKEQIKSYKAKGTITNIMLDSPKFMTLTFTDFYGSLKQVDLHSGLIIADISANSIILDAISWDNECFLVCGDLNPRESSVKVVTRNKSRIIKNFESLHDKPVVNMFKSYVPNVGTCLYTCGADLKVKVWKKVA